MSTKKKAPARKRWSKHVTETSDAMDLEKGVFSQRSARATALSLKHSAEKSHRRKASPFQSAMSMLNFYINRAGDHLSPSKRHTLDKAKDVLRELYDRPPADKPKKKTAAKKRARSGRRARKTAAASRKKKSGDERAKK